MKLTIPEILNKFKEKTTKTERIKVLAEYHEQLIPIFNIIFSNTQFSITELPKEYKPTDNLPGISYSSIHNELRKLYLFTTNSNLTKEKQELLLIQLLESLTNDEATLFINILKKDLKVPYLTPKLINEAYGTQF